MIIYTLGTTGHHKGVSHTHAAMIQTASVLVFFFFFNDTATTEIYTLSLHDALPISEPPRKKLARYGPRNGAVPLMRSEEHTSELQSPVHLVCRLLLEKKKNRLAEHPVLDLDRPQVARPDAEERVPWRLVILLRQLEAFRGARGRPQPLPRRVQEPLPALRPGRVAEGRGVVAAAQPVPARLQRDPPAGRQLRCR